MASNTEHLRLLKMDPAEDANSTFNIKTMLNDNWDKIDAHTHAAKDVGAAPEGHNHDGAYSKVDHTHNAASIGAVPTTRTVNGKALSSDITLGATDVGAAVTATYTATVSTSWTASGNHYYQDITVSGILATDTPIVDIMPGSDNAANVLYSEAMCKVFRITTSANKIRVWATEAINTAFPIQLKVVR